MHHNERDGSAMCEKDEISITVSLNSLFVVLRGDFVKPTHGEKYLTTFRLFLYRFWMRIAGINYRMNPGPQGKISNKAARMPFKLIRKDRGERGVALFHCLRWYWSKTNRQGINFVYERKWLNCLCVPTNISVPTTTVPTSFLKSLLSFLIHPLLLIWIIFFVSHCA